MHGIISTNGIIGAGLKKCMPITLSRILQDDAIEVTEREDVFVARMVDFGQMTSSSENIYFFTSISSIIASITKSHELALLCSQQLIFLK